MGTTVKHSHAVSRRLAAVLGLSAALIGAAGLAAWVFPAEWLIEAYGAHARMKANTGLGIAAAGLSLFAYAALPKSSVAGLVLRRGGGILALLIGALTLLQHLTGADFRIDQLIVADPGTTQDLRPGRMPRAAAAGLVLFGLASALMPRAPAWCFWTGFVLNAVGFWLALFIAVAFVLAPDALYAFWWSARVSVPTAVAFLALFTGVMLAVPDRGWARIVMSDKLGGVMARRLLPLMAVLPLGTLWLVKTGSEHGLYPDPLGEYIAAVVLLIALTTVVLVTSGRLNVLDAQRRTAEKERQSAQAAALRLREISETDALTGLSNRRHFLDAAGAAIPAARGEGRPLSLLMVDIDHFKRINDTFGHAAGDNALRLLGATLKESTRRADCVARLGGEEFAILLPGATAAIAQDIAERICRHTATLAVLDDRGRSFGFTVSIGLAALTPADRRPEDLLARADAALYRAKRAGRNRVEAEPARAAA
jgi:diguanylate cyclase (GGDEF)-like protein